MQQDPCYPAHHVSLCKYTLLSKPLIHLAFQPIHFEKPPNNLNLFSVCLFSYNHYNIANIFVNCSDLGKFCLLWKLNSWTEIQTNILRTWKHREMKIECTCTARSVPMRCLASAISTVQSILSTSTPVDAIRSSKPPLPLAYRINGRFGWVDFTSLTICLR
jgi:hypothetical protein